MPEETDFWQSHSHLREMKDRAMLYAKSIKYRARILGKCPRNATDCPTRNIKIKGLIRSWDPSQSLHNQAFDEILMELDFDEEAIRLYRDLARHFVKFVSGRDGLQKVIAYAALELKYMFGCDIEWNATGTVDAAPASTGAGNAAPPAVDEGAPPAQGNAAPANASNAALSDDGASSDQYAKDADHGGDRMSIFSISTPQLHWTQTGHNHQ